MARRDRHRADQARRGSARTGGLLAVGAALLALVLYWVFAQDGPTPSEVGDGPNDGAVTTAASDPAARTPPTDGVEAGDLERVSGDPSARSDEASGAAVDGPPGMLVGEVQDRDGQPIAEARVGLFRRSADAGRRLSGIHLTNPNRVVETDDSGRFRFPALPAGSRWSVWAWHPDFGGVEGVPVLVHGGRTVELEPLVLPDAMTLSGRVLRFGEGPEPDADLTLHWASFDPNAEDDEIGRVLHARSTADGDFEFPAVGPGAWVLTAHAPNAPPAAIGPIVLREGEAPAPVLVTLSPPFALAGRVVDGKGAPVPDVTVRASPEGGLTARFLAQEALTDVSGRFRFASLGEGVYQLSVDGEGWTPSRPVRVRLGERTPDDVELVVERLQPITGRLVDERGRPVTHAELELWRSIRGTSPYDRTEVSWTVNDPDGRFELRPTGPGHWVLLVRAPGLAPTWTRAFRTGPSPVELGDVQLGPGATVVGRVRVGGEPLGGVSVELRRPDWEPSEETNPFAMPQAGWRGAPPISARTDGEGRFRLEAVPAGDWLLAFEHPSVVTSSRPIRAAHGRTVDLGTVDLQPGATLIVVARDGDGVLLRGGSATLLYDENGTRSRSLDLDEEGRAVFHSVPTGTYWVTASAGGGLFSSRVSDRRRVSVSGGETKEVELTVP